MAMNSAKVRPSWFRGAGGELDGTENEAENAAAEGADRGHRASVGAWACDVVLAGGA